MSEPLRPAEAPLPPLPDAPGQVPPWSVTLTLPTLVTIGVVGAVVLSLLTGIVGFLVGRMTAPVVAAAAPSATAVARATPSPAGSAAAQAVGPQIAPPNASADKSGVIANPGKAKPGARVVIVFQDYQCPWCRVFESAFGAKLAAAAQAGTIQLEYRTMTFLDNNLRNDASTRAAVAASCADVVGAYPAYHDALYKNQPSNEGAGFSDDLLRVSIPQALGITGDKLGTFRTCYDTRATLTFVRGTNDMAGRSGVTGTPTYVIDDVDVTRQLDYRNPASIDTLIGG